MTPWKSMLVALAIAFVVALVIVLSMPAQAHEWYDATCCDDKDCAPVTAPVKNVDGGYYVEQFREVIPYRSRKIKKSLDGDYHVCKLYSKVSGSWIRRLYVPPPGS